jgi:DHA2 family multidrug resistance protein
MTAPGASPPPSPASFPWLGLTAVLLGTFISTLNGRLSSFGLADVRGGLAAGFDEGAWITTAQTTAQMAVAPIAVWVGAMYGPRKPLLYAALAFAITSFLQPFSSGLSIFLILQFAGGLASGFFVPLTLSFILKNSPPRYWAWGVATYALNLELSLNIAASLENWYIDHLSWHFIFWQNIPLALAMALCLAWCRRYDQPRPPTPPPDIYGFITGGGGIGLIYAALDQGNRLDWLNSGTIVAMLAAGTTLMVAFVLHELRSDQPGVDLRLVFTPPLPRLLLAIGFLRLTLLATTFLLPQYLQGVRGFRTLEVGQAAIWIAVPQLLFCPLAAVMLRRTDPRLVSATGFVFISVACLIVAYSITSQWGPEQFLPSQLLQAVGQSFALSGIIFFGVLHLKPEFALTFGAALQMARLMGGEAGLAFIATLSRKHEQMASNLIGLHVQAGSALTQQRLHAYASVIARKGGETLASSRAVALLQTTVHSAAIIQGIIDCFWLIGVVTATALIGIVAQRSAPPGPASHIPLLPRPGTAAQG